LFLEIKTKKLKNTYPAT